MSKTIKFMRVVFFLLLFVGSISSCKQSQSVIENTSPQVAQDTSLFHVRFTGAGMVEEWKVIISDTQIVYAHINGKEKLVLSDLKTTRLKDDKGIVYTGKSPQGAQITVNVKNGECEAASTPFGVQIELNNGGEEALTGCGAYEEDPRLEGKWSIHKLHGKSISPINKDNAPFILFDTKTNALGVNVGCNSMGGQYVVQEHTLMFNSNFVTTLLYCDKLSEIEDTISKAIAGKNITYTFSKGHLLLTSSEGDVVLDCIRL